MIRGMLVGAGGALGVCSQTESLNDIPRGLLEAALGGYNRVSRYQSDPNSSSSQSARSEELSQLTDQIRALRVEGSSAGKQIVVYGGGSSSAGTVVKVALVTTAGVVTLYYFGYGFEDVMYVTKSTLSKAVKGLEEKFGHLGVKLEKTKAELLAMISGVEEAVFASSQQLESKIDGETGKIRFQIGELDLKFGRIETSQDSIKVSTVNLEEKLATLQAKFDSNGVELEKANSGIRLLVNSVVNLPHVKEDKGLMGELQTFLSDNFSWFSSGKKSSSSTSKDKSNEPNNNLKTNGLYSLAGAL